MPDDGVSIAGSVGFCWSLRYSSSRALFSTYSDHARALLDLLLFISLILVQKHYCDYCDVYLTHDSASGTFLKQYVGD